MCLLLVKPKGAKMPSLDIIRKAAIHNPDGFGFVSTRHNCRTLYFREFVEQLRQVKTDENCIIHFRFATHGSVKLSNCHPFHDGSTWFAHNGILNIQPEKDMTDSETAFKYVYMPAIKRGGLDGQELHDAVSDTIGYSKFAFLKDNKIKMFGNFTQINGCYYSNLRFM